MYVLENEPLSAHTTFRIGGAARYYMVPEDVDRLKECIVFAKDHELPYMVIGKGSNILFADEGYEGVVIEIGRGMDQIQISEGGRIEAQAGVSLGALAAAAAGESLSGLEFAGGIPGSLGGAVVMNAGAYGGEIKDFIQEAVVLDEAGEIRRIDREGLELGYRTSIVQRKGYIVLAASFLLRPGKKEEIQEQMRDFNARRREKQPLEYPSAGSTFKRPQGHFAGKLIQDVGLRGYRVGDAQVSEKHCGFVINRGHATAAEVIQLIEEVQKRVYEQSGVRLEPEVRIVAKA